MHEQSWSRYETLLIFLLLNTYAFTTVIPIIRNNTPGLTRNNLTGLTLDRYTCTKPPLPWLPENRPGNDWCSLAVNEIPTSTAQGQFHLDGDNDGFGLPFTRQSGNCLLTVTMRREKWVQLIDVGNWMDLKLAARDLRVNCAREGRKGVERTGGTVMTGLHERIAVSLTRVKKPSMSNIGNETLDVDEKSKWAAGLKISYQFRRQLTSQSGPNIVSSGLEAVQSRHTNDLREESSKRKQGDEVHQNLLLDVLGSTATKREAKAYLSRFPPKNSTKNVAEKPLAGTKDVGVNLGSLYLPIRAVDEHPVFSTSSRQSSQFENTAETLHAALVKIRAPQFIDDETLQSIGHTLSQLVRLGLSCIVVIDPSKGQLEEGQDARKRIVAEEADRIVNAIETYIGQGARRLDSVISVSPAKGQTLPSIKIQGDLYLETRQLLLAPLRRGLIPVITPIGFDTSTQKLSAVDADEVMLALTREFIGLDSQTLAEGDAGKVAHNMTMIQKQVSLDRIIVLDSLGGIPFADGRQGSHVFINLEQEFNSIRRALLDLESRSPTRSIAEPVSPQTLASSPPNVNNSLLKVSDEGCTAVDVKTQGNVEKSTSDFQSLSTHVKNLDLLKTSLALLPPSSSAILTTPEAVAKSESQPSLASEGPRVRTRKQQNPLIHNLLTDKPVFSSSLPSNRSPDPRTCDALSETPSPATFFKRGMPVGMIPDPVVHTWAPPSTTNPSIALSDPRIDLSRLVHLIEDSFNRKLDVPHYLARIKDRIAGIIIAGEYEGGAVLTWETPPGYPSDDPAHMVPYLDKFAVLKRSQGSGGVADIVFNAMVRTCFPHGVCWRSRKNNPVNKWYFERAKGTWKIPDQNWTMFWTTEGVEIHDEMFSKYESVCRSVVPSWAENKGVVD